jgi:hypothetical protein
VLAGGEIERQELPAPTFDERLDEILQDLAAPTTPSAPVFAGPEELGLPGFGTILASPPPALSAPPTPDFEVMATPVAQTNQPGFGGQVASAINDFLKSTLEDPGNIPGMGLIGMAIGQSMSALNEAARNAGYDVLDPSRPEERAAYEAGFAGNRDVADNVIAALEAAPIIAPQYFAPTVGAIPREIAGFVGPGMSYLQQRAAIGAFGTQGSNSVFRNERVRRYYASLLAQELVKNRNQLNEAAYLLPVEQQYLSGIIGRPANTPAQAYESIRGLL